MNTAVHAASAGFAIENTRAEFIDVNDAMCKWLGYSREEMLEMPVTKMVPDKLKNETTALLNDMYQGKRHSINEEKQFQHKNGSLLWGYLSSTAVNNQKGNTEFIVTHIIDISHEKRLSEELKIRNSELEKSNYDLDQFANIASHDLKSPLNAIHKLVCLLETDCSDIIPKTSLQHLSLIKNRSNRMTKLLNDLLLYSRVGRQEYEEEQIDLKTMADDIFDLLGSPQGFSCKTQNAILTVPPIPFELVLRNLISNAIKHHDKKEGRINITCNINQGYIICVKDDGPGIPPNYHEKVTQMFQTLHPKDQVEGSGMGLAVVKKTVEHYGGNITIVSNGESGTDIVVYWPLPSVLEECG